MFLNIKIIDNEYNLVENLINEIIEPGYHSISWSALEQADGYYRFIIDDGEKDCYMNIKKESND